MFFRFHRRFLFLAGFAACVCVSVCLNRPKPLALQADSGEKVGANALVVDKLSVAASAEGFQLAVAGGQLKRTEASASVREVLPRLEHRIDDWREYQPHKLTISPYADLTMEFEMTSVRQEDGRTIWRGRNALSGAFLVTVATQNEWHAVLEIPAASSFEFHISRQAATVTEKNSDVLCGSDRLVASASEAGHADNPVSLAADGAKNSSAEEDLNTVDVLFFYDADTFSVNRSSSQIIDTTIVSMLEAANVVLQNSAVSNLRWHYVGAYLVPDYIATDKLQDDLNLITNSSTPVGLFVADKCALHGVDEAVLFVQKHRKDNYDGLAWVPSPGMVAHNSALVWGTGYVVLAHELAHNFGCHHDRQTENAEDDDGKYSYGFRFNRNGVDTGTVMSYARNRIPFFSNPDIRYEGVRLGVSYNQEKAADNSRVLRENARLMSGYRDATQAPIVISQPQSATVTPGGGFTLSVSATGGGNLAFQWKKNGTDISGANDAVYSKSNASIADDGEYNVVVSNDVGHAASERASVAVTVIAATPTTSVNVDTAGGSGGGAVEPWVLVAFALLGALRSQLRRR